MRRAFSLLEIIFVLGLIAVLISIILPSFQGIQDESKFTKVRTELAVIQAALERYYHKFRDYPQDTATYQDVLINETAYFNKTYTDPFRSAEPVYEYHYYPASSRKYYLLISPGINRQRETDPIENVNPSQGTLVIPVGSDDIIITNLKLVE